MPVKTRHKRPHHVAHRKEKRTKHFLKVYHPYIPLVLMVSCSIFLFLNHQPTQSGSSVKSYAKEISDQGLLDATNSARASEGVSSLILNNELDKAAQAKADDMSAKNYWSHVTPDGKNPWEFIDTSQYEYSKVAENLAYGFKSSKSTVNGWMNSSGHRANVMDANLQEVGFGVAHIPNYQGQGPKTLIVAMYGRQADNSHVASAQANQSLPDTKPQNISYIQSITGGKAPWSGFAVGLLIGAIIMYLIVKHAHGFRKKIRQGEKFIIKHPVFDATMVALLVLAIIASNTIGTIH